MNFFEHQEAARRASKRLLWLFAASVLVVVAGVNFVLAAAAGLAGIGVTPAAHAAVAAGVLLLIGGGTLWQMRRLASGGEAVAALLGARAVDPATGDLLERRLLNVVEEMALATGVPVPRCYLLEHQRFINACAAGHTLANAAVIVTRGALTRLSRDELQGVVAHEFSHIVHGDMALNLRMIGVVHGLLVVALAGQKLLEGGTHRDTDGRGTLVLLAAGVGLIALGYLGVACGRAIKAGVARGREFLADASAVRFTRNRDGIGGALRKIGGLGGAGGLGAKVSADAGEMAARLAGVVHADDEDLGRSSVETFGHLFITPGSLALADGAFATHPPLAERVRRIYGRPMDWLPAPEEPVVHALAAAPAARELPPLAFAAQAPVSPVAALVDAAPTPEAVAAAIGGVAVAADAGRALLARLDAAPLREAVADSTRAPLLALAMLFDKNSPVGAQQKQAIADALGAAAAAEIEALHTAVQPLEPGLRLPLLDRAAPALRKLPASSGDRLLALALALIAADGRVTLPEFLLYTVLTHRIGAAAQRAVPVRYPSLAPLADDVARILGLLARVRAGERAADAFAAGAALLPQLPMTLPESIGLDRVRQALTRLNELAPLAKPGFIKACAAVAFFDGQTHWQAASALRTVCAAIDAPLPPQMAAVDQ